MFFTTKVSLPFSDVVGVIDAFPTWNLVTVKEYDIVIQSQAASKGGPEAFKKYTERIKDPRYSKYKVDSFNVSNFPFLT